VVIFGLFCPSNQEIVIEGNDKYIRGINVRMKQKYRSEQEWPFSPLFKWQSA